MPGSEPIPQPRSRRAAPFGPVQRLELGLLERLNRRHLQQHPTDALAAARMRSFETAFGMQMTMPEVLDLSQETEATLKLYGLERGSTKGFAWQCLVARRMAERGVRVVELIDVGSEVNRNWDGHSKLQTTYERLAKNVDQPIAALIKDLKSRGLLDDTLVVWTTEFGRSPWSDSPDGRNHHGRAFCSWMAGGGVKGGMVLGKTDEHGNEVVENRVHVHDFHATILHLLGLDHERLTFRNAGRDFRLTDVYGNVIQEVLA